MTIRIRLFAIMAQQAGERDLSLTLGATARVEDVVDGLKRRFPAMQWPPSTMLAVNQEYADPGRALQNGDEVAIIPPVSGGARARTHGPAFQERFHD